MLVRPSFRWIVVAAALTALALAAGALGAAAKPPGGHLAITEVRVDVAAGTITIVGEELDFGRPLTVALGELGEITPLCTASFAPPQTIVCDFSATGLPPAGDYLLTVATGAGQSRHAEYDLTLGGAGLPGPAGEPGAPGEPGPPGPPGPPGTTTFYTVSAVAHAVGAGDVEVLSAEALCAVGDPVVGGGFTHDVAAGPHSMPVDIVNAPNAGGTGWIGSIERILPAGSTLTVWARCADATP